MRKWNQEQIAILSQGYPDPNVSVEELASSLGKSVTAIQLKAMKLGIRRDCEWKEWTEEQVTILRKLYPNLDVSVKEIASMVGHSTRAINLKANLLHIQRRKLLPIEHRYFEIIDTPIKAYLLGLIAADGHIRNDGGCYVRLALQKKDCMLIDRVREELSPKSSIISYRNAYALSICSRDMTKDLIDLGVGANKTTEIQWPNINDALAADFILGFFDGDGMLYWHKQNKSWHWSLVGTLPLLTAVKEQILLNTNILVHGPKRACKDRSPFLYKIDVYRQDDIRLLDAWLNRSKLGLPRKHL
jgi:hypothetical protein